MILHPKQQEIVKSNARFKVVRSGRRSGKSTYAIEEMCFTAVSGKDRNIFYTAPTMIQARNIIWEALKSRLAGIAEVNEARLEMKVPTIDGGTSIIYVKGWENRENFRGMKAHLEVFDELDTMKDFFIGWQEIFRPALTDTRGKAIFIGTPKKENPNLRRLEKEAKADWECFHFKTEDNPHIPPDEIVKAKEEIDYETYKQEYLAEYVDHAGSLFNYLNLVDVFSNTITKDGKTYLIVDVADDGGDKTIFSRWEGLEEVEREEFSGINTEAIINKIREYATQYQIPYSNIAVDAIGVGAGVASSSFLNGIVGYKSSFSPIKTDMDIVRLPNVHYTKDASLVSDYKNLRSQCVFTLADLVDNHKIASRVTGKFKERVLEELSVYQDASTGDGKRMATMKDDIKALIGHSPDHSDTWVMRMYFVIRNKMSPDQSEERAILIQKMHSQMAMNRAGDRSTK